MAISVDLGPNLDAVVDGLVKNGRYGSKSEVLREGVRLVQERELALAELDASLLESIAQLEAGQGIPIDEAFEQLRQRYKPAAE
jgi:antitoxin ParD1/3/4